MKTFLVNLAQNPKACLTKVLSEKQFAPAIFGYVLGVISLYFAVKLLSQNTADFCGFLFIFIVSLSLNLLLNFILAALAHLFFEFMDEKTKAGGLFILLGISQLILTLLIPLCLIAKPFIQLHFFMPLGFIAVFFLQIYFILNSIKQIYGPSKVSAFLALGGAFILPFIGAFCLMLFIISMLISLFA